MSEAAVPKPKLAAPTFPGAAPAVMQTAQPPLGAGRMALSKISRGKIAKPIRVLIYGVEGVGKSTFAASAPGPVFLGAEDGTTELDVARFSEPQSWLDVVEATEELLSGEHTFETLVIDSLDWIEPLCWAHLCATRKTKNGKRAVHIEDYGFGAGYTAALDIWRSWLTLLERLRNERRMNVILIAHSWIKTFKNPAGDDYDRYEMKLHAKAAGLLREWCNAVLFATHETYTRESNGRAKGLSSGARIILTERTAAWDAKNRHDLPPKLPLDWVSFSEAVAAHRPASPERLKARIAELLEQLGEGSDKLRVRVEAAVISAGDDAAELARIENKLAATIGDTMEESAS